MRLSKIISAAFLALLFQFSPLQSAGKAALKTGRLTCEYLVNPLGIEVLKPRLSWTLLSTMRNQQQTGYEMIVSDNIMDVKRMKGNVWQTGKISSSQNIHVTYEGSPLKPFTRYHWRVKVYGRNGTSSGWSQPQWFETAMLNTSGWQGKWIGDDSKQFEKDSDFYKNDPMPLFRKTFNVDKKLVSARLYISGIGYYESYLNGEKIGDHMLDPGWTSYNKQVLYTVYDITAQINKGLNAAGIMLGNGWYNPLPLKFWGGLNMRDALVSGRPCVKAMIRLHYADGSLGTISTDESWQTSDGPVIRNSIFLGEHYDARAEKENWNTIDAVTSNWKNAVIVAGPKGTLSAQMQPPVRITKIIKPLSVTEVKPGVFIFDMGQNFAGVARFRVKGAAGTQLKVRYGEDKYADGSLNVMTAVAGQIKGGNGGPGAPHVAWQEDSYILKGSGPEEWSPRFTFHGFRYIEVTGWPGKPGLADIDGLRMSADLRENGTFSSSNEMFNKLDTNIKFTFLSNVFSVQSDCPAREKLGYGGDLFCATESFMYHYDMAGFYRKVVKDFTDDQQPLGGITETVPFVGIADSGPGDKSGPLGFQVGFPYLIKKLHDFYGDKRIIEENYAALTRHINFLESRTKDNLFVTDLGDHESLDDRSIPFTASIFYYLHAKMMDEFAGILDKQSEKARYARLSEKIRKAILEKFNPAGSGKFEKGTQTAQIFALWSNIEKEGTQDKVIALLVSEFEKKNWHLSTGIFGTKMLFDVLRKADQNELAYRIANQRDFPGWGFMIANGATTVWETWAASDNVFSKNHPMFGSIGEWFYRSLLGINSAAPGFKKIILKPQPAGDLKHAEGSYASPYGKIGSAWQLTDQKFNLKVEIPVNTTAEIWLPLKYGTRITEGNRPLADVEGIVLQRKENSYTVIQVGSGIYSFSVSSVL